MGKLDPKVDEAIQTLNMKDGPTRRRLLQGTGLVSATAAASALLAACGSSSGGSTANAASNAAGNFPATPKYKFTFVNHVTDNAFFTPTQYGFQDCAALLGIDTPSWTGANSTQPTVPTMLTALNAAIASNSDGIATTVVDATAFVSPINKALTAGIPVVTYNANGATNSPTNGLAYVGQELYVSGQQVGARIAAGMPHGGTACGIIAQPGSLNIQPRLDGANAAILAAGKGLKILHTAGFDSGASQSQETTTIPEFIQANGPKLQGVFAVDGGSTALLGPALAKFGLVGKVSSGGFDLEPATLTAIKAGQLGFTIDQSPYLQGFLPCLYLYLFQLSGGLVSPSETDTGLKFVTKANAAPYTSPSSRFEGSTKAEQLIKRSGPISV
ncbi:MAG TPA: substrate-binding domain-containing protein [Streptosporangiaceae bacterium]|nr:substrate-binding domain-containing protein [Streptosporangiaceae bacterium]